MTPTTRTTSPVTVAALAALAVACGADAGGGEAASGGLEAAPAGPPAGVVVEIRQESTTRNVLAESVGNEAAAAGVDAAMLSSIFGMLTDAAGMGLSEAPPQLADALPENLMLKLRVGGHLAAHEIDRALREARVPKTESSTYSVYIRPDLFKVDADGATMVWRPAGSAGPAGMWVSDASGPLTAVDLGFVDSMVGDAAGHSGMEVSPMPGAAPREILGYAAHGYTYRYTLDLNPGGAGAAGGALAMLRLPIAIENVVEGQAWVAREADEAADIAAFFRNFASSFGSGSGMLGGLTGGMSDLAELGVPLETSQTVRTWLVASLPNLPERLLVMEATSTSTVTDIRRMPLGDEVFFGPNGPPTAGGVGPTAGGATGATPAFP